MRKEQSANVEALETKNTIAEKISLKKLEDKVEEISLKAMHIQREIIREIQKKKMTNL